MTTKNPRRRADPYAREKMAVPGPFPGPDALPDVEEPLPDAMYQDPLHTQTAEVLRSHFAGAPSTLVNGSLPIYYRDEEGRRHHVKPDCCIAFEVDVAAVIRRNGYVMEEMGRAPDFALEIASASTHENDEGPKREIYARLGVREYWRFDGTGGSYYAEPLVGEELVNGEYRRLAMYLDPNGWLRGRSPALGLDLCWQPERLRFFDPVTQTFLRNLVEAEARADAEQARRLAAEADLLRLREELSRLQG
jgi:Uma2 family endonuclease